MPLPLTPPGVSPELQTYVLRDFTGGLNVQAFSTELNPNESPRIMNCMIDPRGGFHARSELKNQNTTEIPITGGSITNVWAHHDLATGDRQILAHCNDKIYSAHDTDTSFGDTLITGGADSANLLDAAAFGGMTILMRGAANQDSADYDTTSGFTYYTNSVGAWQDDFDSPSGAHMPRARRCETHHNMFWVASTRETAGVEFKNRIRFSHPGDEGSWREQDWIDIDPGEDVDPIVALVSFRDHLLVFKTNSIWAVFGYDFTDFQVVNVSNTIGCLSPKAVQSTEQGVFFVDQHGVYVYDGARLQNLSEKLGMCFPINLDQRNFVCLVQMGDYVWVGGTGSTFNFVDTLNLLCFDLNLGAWTTHYMPQDPQTGTIVRGYDDGGSDTPVDRIIFGFGGTGWVGQFLADPVDGGRGIDRLGGVAYPIPWHFQTAFFDAGEPFRNKKWKRPEVHYKDRLQAGGGGMTHSVDVYQDWNTLAVAKTLTWEAGDGAADEDFTRLSSFPVSRSVSFDFRGHDEDSSENGFAIRGITVKWRNRAVKG